MKVDNPQAYRFILQDQVYLLNEDKAAKPVIANEAHSSLAEASTAIKTPGKAFNYLGGNNKKFLILVNYANAEHMEAAHLTALENILLRKELNLRDVAIFNIHTNSEHSFEKISEYFKPEKVLILGKDALPAQIEVPPLNQPAQLYGCAVLYSYSFTEMMSSTDNKRTFWEQMKKH